VKRPAYCVLCLIENRLKDLLRFGAGEAEAVRLLRELARLAELSRTEAFVESFELVKKVLKVEDPYSEVKRKLDELAAELEHYAKALAARASPAELLSMLASANAFDTQVLGYEFSGFSLRDLLSEPKLVEANLQAVESAKRFALILDNSGEVIFDAIVARELAKRGAEVVVVARGEPYEIDVTGEEALESALFEGFEVVTTGGPYPALYSAKVPKRVAEALEGADVVLAKGIANFEAFLDSGAPYAEKIVFLLRAKCPVIAEAFGVERRAPIVVSGSTALRKARGLLGAVTRLERVP